MLARPTIGTMLAIRTPSFTGRVHVREDGPADAPPLVLLHGFCGSMHWWDLVVPALAGSFRVIRVDLLGHGSTRGPAADAPVQADALEAVLDELDVTGVTVVGHSFGADVAVEVAQRSARIERLIILTQAPDYSDAVLPRAGALVTMPVLGAALSRAGQLVAVVAGGVAAVTRGHRTGTDLVLQGLRDYRALNPGMFRVVLDERRERMAGLPLDAQVRAAGKPTLAILGGRDHFYGDRAKDRYLAAGAQVHVLPDSGHSPQVEVPDEIADLIAAFSSGIAVRLP